MPAPEKPPNRLRLQISLRMLLLLMAVVGVALTVYRWPWIVTTRQPVYDLSEALDPFDDEPVNAAGEPVRKVLYEVEWRTTYRRNWRAEGVKNGPAQLWRNGQLWQEEHYYDGKLNGPLRVFDEQGRLVMEATYRDNLLHGPFREGDGTTWIRQGTHRSGEPHGVWRFVCERQGREGNLFDVFPPVPETLGNRNLRGKGEPAPLPVLRDPLVIVGNFDRSKRHGLWTWQSPAGEVLFTVEYAQNELVRWNGEPVVEQFRQWLLAQPGPEAAFLVRLNDDRSWQMNHYGRPNCQRLTYSDQRSAECCFLNEQLLGNREPLWVNRESRLLPWLCEFALGNGYRFDWRYGSLWMVPAADPEPPFIDPTGVDQILFAEGSPQARDWAALIDVNANDGYTRECIEQLFQGSSIGVDCSAIVDGAAGAEGPPAVAVKIFTRSRQHALGHVLYQTGCRCELRGNTLHILPREGRTVEQMLVRPLTPGEY